MREEVFILEYAETEGRVSLRAMPGSTRVSLNVEGAGEKRGQSLWHGFCRRNERGRAGRFRTGGFESFQWTPGVVAVPGCLLSLALGHEGRGTVATV